MPVLLQVQACEIELVVGLCVDGRQGGLCGIWNGADLIFFRSPRQQRCALEKTAAVTLATGLFFADGKKQVAQWGAVDCDRLLTHFFGCQCHQLVEIGLSFLMAQHDTHPLPRCGQHLEAHAIGGLLDIHHEVFRGLFHNAYLTVGHEVLHKLFLLIGHQPREVGLVLGIYTGHQFDIGAESLAVDMPLLGFFFGRLIGQVTVPGTAEVAVAPGPLLLAR